MRGKRAQREEYITLHDVPRGVKLLLTNVSTVKTKFVDKKTNEYPYF